MFKYRPVRAVKVMLFVALLIALLGAVVMQLWNALLPNLFGWRAITFAQASGLLILSRILFGGMRGPGLGEPPWLARARRRWQQLSPEELAKLQAGPRNRCALGPTTEPVRGGDV